MASMVRDPLADVLRPVVACRKCGGPIYWGFSQKGKRVPLDVDERGEPTRINHLSWCPGGKPS